REHTEAGGEQGQRRRGVRGVVEKHLPALGDPLGEVVVEARERGRRAAVLLRLDGEVDGLLVPAAVVEVAHLRVNLAPRRRAADRRVDVFGRRHSLRAFLGLPEESTLTVRTGQLADQLAVLLLVCGT